MNLLARREHTRRELRCKLQRRFPDPAPVERELQKLADERLQSDERFAQSYVRHRSERGYGPLRLQQEMRERGLDEVLIDTVMSAEAIDWTSVAAQVYRRKFGESQPGDIREKAKRSRFMQYRGFRLEHFRSLIE